MCRVTHLRSNNKRTHGKKKSSYIYGEGKEIQTLSKTHPSFPFLIESSRTDRSEWKTTQWFGEGRVSAARSLFSRLSARGHQFTKIPSEVPAWCRDFWCIKNPQGLLSLSYHKKDAGSGAAESKFTQGNRRRNSVPSSSHFWLNKMPSVSMICWRLVFHANGKKNPWITDQYNLPELKLCFGF